MNLNLLAPICTSGYSGVAQEILKSLVKTSNISLFPIGPVEMPDDNYQVVADSMLEAWTYDRNAPSLRIYHQFSLAEHVGKGTHAGFPIFELDQFTERERHHLNSQDLLFVASEWAKKILEENKVKSKVVVAPFGVNMDLFKPGPLPERSTTTFLHCGKLEYRKGVYDVLEAFTRAFSKDDHVRLIFHIHNPFMQANAYKKLFDEFLGMVRQHSLADRIVMTPGRFKSVADVANLMRDVDCGLFPSRAEGWNLELSEMLAMGRHCIATDYSGHTEFAKDPYCRMIDVDSLETAYDGVYFFGQGKWAKLREPQMEQLVSHMRSVHRLKQDGCLLVNEAGVQAMREFTWDRTATVIKEALQ